jgi:hypothetical protein
VRIDLTSEIFEEAVFSGCARRESLGWWKRQGANSATVRAENFAERSQKTGELTWVDVPVGQVMKAVLAAQLEGKTYRLLKIVTRDSTQEELERTGNPRMPVLIPDPDRPVDNFGHKRPMIKVGDRAWTYNRHTMRPLPAGLEDLTELKVVKIDPPEVIVRRSDGAEFTVAILSIEPENLIEIGGRWVSETQPAALERIAQRIEELKATATENHVQEGSIASQVAHLEFILRRQTSRNQ